MSMAEIATSLGRVDRSTYVRRIRAWTMYDWAMSAFQTTILGAILPVYYSQVAAANLPSRATATAYWTLGLSLSLLVIAIISPILGTVSDISRSKKRFLRTFIGVGVLGTALLVLVDTGDWLMASIFFVVARIGLGAANVFYDSLLPHVAREEDRDSVSARGYALGYFGGGLLLAANAAMIRFIPGNWGWRLSFLSVAVWWAIFAIPILTRVPEPPTATAALTSGQRAVGEAFRRMKDLFADIRQYRDLFTFLIAFLIYSDGIGTIIGVGAIYGAELGLDEVSLVLAVLMIQFVGVPFSLVFGRLPSPEEKRRAIFLAFIVFNLVVMPVLGIVGGRVLPAALTGAPVMLPGAEQAVRESNLGAIIGLIVGVAVIGGVFAVILGRPLFSRFTDALDTKRSILLSLVILIEIAVMGFLVDSVLEFWALSWMVAVVLGGSQALSRSLYASMSPAAKSGEFFGLYSVMAKFSAIIGPALFAVAVAIFDSSRPAILSLVAIFVIGGVLLARVDTAEGQRIAREEDTRLNQR